jgi:myo-inositol-1(or 4)-monophosphatase
MTPQPSNSSYLEFARALAAECSQVAANQFRSGTARRKSDGTLVTKTDEEIDRLISARLAARFPTHAVLSEEQSTLYDGVNEFTWIVDPLDGTTNFARGLPIWGVSIGLLQHGAPIVGVVDFPLIGECFWAIAGEGAWRSEDRITTSAELHPNDEHFLMKCTRTERIFVVSTPLKSRVMGSAAYHLCKIADGTALAGIEATPKVWDLAAAYLILVEAGGSIVTASGETIFPLPAEKRDYRVRAYTTFAAGNASLLAHLQKSTTRRTA